MTPAAELLAIAEEIEAEAADAKRDRCDADSEALLSIVSRLRALAARLPAWVTITGDPVTWPADDDSLMVVVTGADGTMLWNAHYLRVLLTQDDYRGSLWTAAPGGAAHE